MLHFSRVRRSRMHDKSWGPIGSEGFHEAPVPGGGTQNPSVGTESLMHTDNRFEALWHAPVGFGLLCLGLGAQAADSPPLDVNEAFCRMLGYTRAELLATPWSNIAEDARAHTGEPVSSCLIARVLDHYATEVRLKHKQGQDVWTKFTLVLVRNREGQPDHQVAIVEDIGEPKRAEQALRDANRRVNEFLAVLSHELRNPLAPIRNSVYILDRIVSAGEQARRAIGVIDRQAQHMTRLVEDLLDITRISRGKINLQRERLDLCTLVRRTAEDHRELFTRNGIALHVALPEQPVWVYGDPTRLAQVIGNLLSNSAKFTPRGGTASLTIDVSAQYSEAVIRIRDNGVGMSADTVNRLFEPFMQATQTLERTRGGLGLGLALAKELVEMHGGRITAKSEGEGRGAEFCVSVPLNSATLERMNQPSSVPGSPNARRVLVIEDNVDAAESLREALEVCHHEVLVARTGPEGVEAARLLKPDAILCDIGLPGLDGYGVAQALRADPDPALRSVLMVAVTGYALQEDIARSKAAGFDHHIAKPPHMDAIERLLAQTARSKPNGGAADPGS